MADVLTDAIAAVGAVLEQRITDIAQKAVLAGMEVQQRAFTAGVAEEIVVKTLNAIKDTWLLPPDPAQPVDEAPARADPDAADVPDTSVLAHIPS